MKYRSVFDIIGPIMVGPSSSHTAGAARIGRLARRLFGAQPDWAAIHFYGSFAQTYRGHATDVAVVAGILDLETNDPRIPDAFLLAKEQGLTVDILPEEAVPDHPNTMTIVLHKGQKQISVTGISIGGGLVQLTQVDGFALRLSGECPALLIFHRDVFGTIAAVTSLLARAHVNISHMEVSRMEKGKVALMVIETDQQVPANILDLIEQLDHVRKIVTLSI